MITHRTRWSDNDSYFGPFLYAQDKYRSFACVLDSGDDEEYPGCRLRVQALGHVIIVSLPPIIKPYKRKVYAKSWDAETVKRMGRDWYFHSEEREYGFSYGGSGSMGDGGFLQLFLGRQTNDSSTEQRWSCLTPWNNWRHVRHSFYGLEGNHVWTTPEVEWKLLDKDQNIEKHREILAAQEAIPTRTFSFADFDGEQLTAKTRIEEREWRLGTGWLKWLSFFKKPLIRRSLDIDFSGETGRRKGSWKGGTTGHSIDMLPDELHEAAFRRYCEGEDSRHGKREMKFIGEV